MRNQIALLRALEWEVRVQRHRRSHGRHWKPERSYGLIGLWAKCHGNRFRNNTYGQAVSDAVPASELMLNGRARKETGEDDEASDTKLRATSRESTNG